VSHNNQNAEKTAPTDAADALADAIESLFQPLARMLVRQGIGARSTLERIKRAYVSATIDVLKERELPITSARLSVFTGLTAREIDNITATQDKARDPRPNLVADLAALLTAWHEDSRYAFTLAGTPYELDYEASGTKPTFTALVQEFAPGYEPREVLQELISAGAARINPETNRIQAIGRVFITEPYSRASAQRIESLLRNLTETLYENSQTPDVAARLFDRKVMADFAIDDEAESAFKTTVRKSAAPFLESLDKWLQEQPPATENGRRVGVAVFGFVETREDTPGKLPKLPPRPKRLGAFPGVDRSPEFAREPGVQKEIANRQQDSEDYKGP
jgi:hypothetical protein